MGIELDPEQAPEVERVVAALLDATETESDPWWQAGIADALEPFDA